MAFPSPQEEAGARVQRDSARQSKALADEAFPLLREVISQAQGDINIDQTGKIGVPFSVQRQFDQQLEGMNRDFDISKRGSEAYTAQSFKQSGNPYSENQLNDTIQQNARMLEEARGRATNQLKLEEARAGMSQYNNLMNIMLGAEGSALNLAGGFGAQRGRAIGFLPNQSQEGGAISGGIAGASAGSSFGPYGALAGLFIGAGLGYAGSA